MRKRYAITIDEDVYKALKIRAVRDDKTVGDVIASLVDHEPDVMPAFDPRPPEERHPGLAAARTSFSSKPFTPVPKK